MHVLGAVDVDGHGIAGVERSFDERLRRGDGDPLRLSIDIRVQLALRDAVQRAITEFNGIGGAGVLLDVNTGEVKELRDMTKAEKADPAWVELPAGLTVQQIEQLKGLPDGRQRRRALEALARRAARRGIRVDTKAAEAALARTRS